MPAIVWVFLALPILPIVLGWRRFSSLGGVGREQLVMLLLPTISYCLLVLGLLFPPAIGADYTTRRFATIEVKLMVMVLLLPWAAMRGGALRHWVLMAGLAAGVTWVYALAMSSMV